jgi:ATPase subunit of ABC transporter with duplicated ATPase domains
MANFPFVTLHGVDFTLPDGTLLFQDLSEAFAGEAVGLIGRNGSGKSTLGKLVSGELAPTSGRIERAATVYRVAQQSGPVHATTLAELAGLAAPLAALRRLARGEALASDLETVRDQWDLEARWQALLDLAGLDETRHPALLSGGQRMLLALIGGFCSDAGLLVLDEPSNHLDREHRELLAREIDRWRQAGRGLLLITHDRNLLANVDRTLETRPPRVQRYGGGWETVEQQRRAELDAACARLDRARSERRREQAGMRNVAERAERRSARGAREGREANQAKLLLGGMRGRAEHSDGARHERQALRRQELEQEVMQAFEALGDAQVQPEFPHLPECAVPQGQSSLVIEDMVGEWGWARPFSWTAQGPVRVAIRGANGCGKTTLMHLIAGRLQPRSGRCRTALDCALIDQSLAMLDHDRPLLEQLAERARGVPEGRLRQHLAKAGIASERLRQPVRSLSGGEQMRGALLCSVLATPPARMLLLDEPSNHLDLQAAEALETMLRTWTGALVVVSHDDAFLGALGLTHHIDRAGDGWTVQTL